MDRMEFERKFLPFYRGLLSHAKRLTPRIEDAEDLVQDTYSRAWEFRSTFLPRSELRDPPFAWIYTILHNQLMSNKRKYITRLVRGYDEFPREQFECNGLVVPPRFGGDLVFTPDNLSEWERHFKAYLTDRQWKFLIRVPKKCLVPLVLSVVSGYSYEDLADILSTPIGTVKSRIFRGRRKLAL